MIILSCISTAKKNECDNYKMGKNLIAPAV
jgi:hypothetical protein